MSAEPTQAVRTERSQKRVRAFLAGDLVADTSAPLLVWENTSYPAYYIPAADMRADLIPAGQSERRTRLGEAELMHVKTAVATAELAARRYPDSPVGIEPAEDPVRDRAATTVLPASCRSADGPAPALGPEHEMPVQGHGVVLVGRHESRRRARPPAQGRRVDLPDAAA